MAITSRPQDKFAFLFTGPTLPVFITDLQHVFEVLTQYYNYPAANITVVLGSTPSATPSFPGATVTTIGSVAALNAAIATFIAAADGPAPGMAGFSKTALFYSTGGGENSTATSTLLIDGGSVSTSNTVDASWLTARLNTFTDCHVDVVMQQAYAGGFLSALTGSTLSQWSFTRACSATEISYLDLSNGGFFTFGWTKGLKYEVLPAGTPNVGQFADTLGSAGEATNNLISLQEAMEFGKQIHDFLGGTATPGYSESGGTQYLGLPAFLIRDGSPSWWESPDIYLTHPNDVTQPPGDLYIPDAVGASAPFNNTINVDARNVGTHPVRRYSLGIELFKSGIGVTNDQQTLADQVPSGGLLLPIDLADIGTAADKLNNSQWNTPFTLGTTHECITAEAKLLASSVDFSWSITANDFEGQRNTDQMPLAPMPPPEPAPEPAQNLQGKKQHVYGIYNRFDTERRFAVVFPPDYQKLGEILDLTWFEHSQGPKSEVIPLRVIGEPRPHLLFTLRAGEAREIILRAGMKQRFETREPLRLPFSILVEGERPQPRGDANPVEGRVVALKTDLEGAFGLDQENFAAIAGFTVVIEQAAATLRGTVLDEKKKPAVKARVFLQTVDGLQGTVVTTDDNGRFELADINPDVYRVWTEAGNWRSNEQIVPLNKGAQEQLDLRVTEDVAAGWTRAKVILDRIRILDDHDPCVKAGGEFVFTSVVVPDNDETAKQVTRLPGNGHYAISDKPGQNDLYLGVTLFEGVVKNGSLSLTIGGQELDLFDPDDDLTRYHREFSGKPETWFGNYQPSDEYLDREDLSDWALWYRIVPS